MIWSFKNKLRSLSEDEFTEYLQKKDNYSKKQHPYIVQEARNRYFSNKEFNGDDDQYINPRSRYSKMLRRNARIKRVSAVLSLFIVATAIFFTIKSNPQFTDKLLTAIHLQNNGGDLTTNTTNPPNLIAENETPDKLQPGKKNKEVVISNEPIKQITPSTSKTVAANKQSEVSKTPEQITPKQKIENNTTSQDNKPIIPPLEDKQNTNQKNTRPSEIEINNTEQTIKEKKVIIQTETPQGTAAENEKTNQNQTQNKPEVEDQAPAPVAKPEQKEPINSLVDVSKLPTKRLRKFIPFLNDWAYQQTNLPGIADYYVENNSIVNFQLTEAYNDSLTAFRQNKSKQLLQLYQKDLSTKLGDSFPKVAIEIHFVDSNTDL